MQAASKTRGTPGKSAAIGGSRRFAKFLFGFTLGMSAVSSYAITIDQVVADMSSPSEAMVIDPRYSWQSNPAVTMYAPRGDAIPSWWTGNRPEWCYNVLTWFTAFEAQGNGATNTRVQIANLRFYILSQNTRTWKQYDMKAAPGVDIWQYPFNYTGGSSGVRNESSGGISIKPKYPNFHHGYGNSVNITPQDVRAVYVAMDFRLAVDDPNKPDDRASAKYVVDTGGDYWPGNGQGDWSLGYAPGMGNGRMLLATSSWRTATMIIPNPNYGATMAEMKSNPPPGVDGSGTATTTTTAAATTTTKASTTTTKASTTTTASSVTTTKASTTTTVGSTTTTTLASNTGTTGTTTAYADIAAKNSGKCLDVSGWSTADGGSIVQWSCKGSDNQKWAVRDAGNGQVQVLSKSSGKCLTVPNGSTANGTALKQYACSNTASQLWTRRTAASGYSQLVSAASGKCVNVRGFSSANGAAIEQATCATSDSQLLALPAATTAPTTSTSTSTSTAKTLTSQVSGKCLDVTGWSTANGTVLQQWSCAGNVNQQWVFKDMGNSQIEVISKNSGKCAEVQNGGLTNGTPVQQSDCTGSSKQLWTLVADGSYTRLKSAVSGKCMDVTGWSTADGARTQQWDCGAEAPQQRWTIK
ncbi:MAG: RICIN domain-containing protein [Burkholderiales bacterium]|nr:RICIN domain-containing protein [Burkholderiales bacterium]